MALFGAKKNNEKNKTAAKKEAVSMQDLYSAPAAAVKSQAAGMATSVKGSSARLAYKFLLQPLITEKATHLNAANKYVFSVAPGANKITVAQAITEIYGVKPLRVNILNVSGKKVTRGRIQGQRSDWRKAIITLKSGDSIKVYEGV